MWNMLPMIGNVLRNKIMKTNKYWIIGAMFIVILAVWGNGLSDMYSMQVGNVALYVIGGMSGTYLLIQSIKKYKRIQNCRPLTWAENNALVILETHQLYLTWIVRNTKLIRSIWGTVVVFAFILISEFVVTQVIKKLK